ncbi:phage tail spike protein [Bacillus sp. NPDC057893]|uniref:phage tail spike protein n=1 Tax=Bacillus sp. NPDC057893 TaxID=3346273 RepID=UPI00366D2E4F
MRTPGGILHIIDFKTSQTVSAIQPKDYWDDKRHWEIKNNIDTLEFKVFDNTKYAATLMQQNLVLKEVRNGRIVPYVITEVEKDPNDRSVITYASGAWINLAKDDYIRPQKIEGKTVNEFMDIALVGTKWKRGKTEYAGFHSMTIDEFIDPLSFLKKIASLFELEIIYRVEVAGSQIAGWYVDMVKKRGRETGKEVTLGKDLVGIKRIENSQNICTALIGFIKKEGGEVLTIADINKGMPYIVDNDAFQRWNEKGKHKFGFYTPETEQDITPERLLILMKTELAKRVNTSISYDVQAQSIGRVFGLAHELINEGDAIRIKDIGFTPKLYLEARTIAGDESYKNPLQDKYVFGDYREITDPNEELRKIYNRILSSLGSKQELIDQLDKLVKDANETANNAKKDSEAAKTLAEKVQENLKNNTVEIIEAKNPPTTGMQPYKTLWRDISNGKPGILKIWTGTVWESVVPDVEKVKKETLEQVNTQIESTKKELNTKVADVQKEAQAIAGQISDVKKEVQGKVDSNFVKEQIKDKADKSGIFTKDEINNGFIGKQIYETDKQGNVKKFQEISTSFEQTNEAIRSKAEKQSVTDLGNNVTQVSKIANEAKQTAEGTIQTITELKATVENTEIGVRNLLLETAIKSHLVKTGENKPHTYFDVAKDAATLMQGKNLAMSFLFTGKVTAWGTTNKWVGFEVKITFADNTSQYSGCRAENRITLGKQYNQERFTASSVVMDKPIKEISVYVLARDFTGDTLIEKLKLEIGTVPTAWTPAPEDQVTATDFTKKTVEIENNINGIKNSVSAVQNEQGKLTERVTKSEQTAEGFKTSIESLTKKDSEISNKLNTVESTVEGTKKTISDVQQTTSELKKTTTEIKEEAGKISTKLEQVDARTVGGENWLINTGQNQRPQTIGMSGGAQVNKAGQAFSEDYMIVECTDHTDSFYQFHLDNTKMSDYEKGKDMTFSIDLQNDVPIDLMVFQFINGAWAENLQNKFLVANWSRRSFTFKLDVRATGWGLRLRFERNENSKGKKFRFKKAKLEKGSVPTDFSKSTYELEQSVDGVKTTVTNVQNSQVGFEKRMTTVEQTASGLSSTVSNLNNVVDSQGKKLTDANSKLEQQAKEIGAKVAIKEVEDYVAGFKIPDLKNTVNQNKTDLLNELANKLATEQYNQKMTLIDNRFTINEQGINAAAKKTEVYTKEQANGQFATSGYVRDMESRLTITEKGVSISVKENEVIAAFNMSKENITLNANKINLVGYVTAAHIKGQVLEGVELRTVANTSNGRYISITQSNIKMFDDTNNGRLYLGFYGRDDSGLQPTFLLGRDSGAGYNLSGTMSFTQVVPKSGGSYDYGQATGRIGMIAWYNASTNTFSHNSYIDFIRDGGHAKFYADGQLTLQSKNDVYIGTEGLAGTYGGRVYVSAASYAWIKANKEVYIESGNGNWTFSRTNKPSEQNAPGIKDDGMNADFRLAYVLMRSSHVSGYQGSLQIKSVNGNEFRDLEARNIKAVSVQQTSTRKIKTAIKDIEINSLDKLMGLKAQQYYFKSDMDRLYEMRENRKEGDPLPTVKDIPLQYGFIAEDSDDVFTTAEKEAINLYPVVSLTIDATQKIYIELKDENKQLKEEIKEVKEETNRRIEVLEQLLVQNLINMKPEQS